VALNSYHAVNYFLTGQPPSRVGNAHPHMVPYNLFDCADGQVILAIGNDTQFASFCRAAGRPALAADPDFATVTGRQLHRDRLVPAVAEVMRERTMKAWFALLAEANVPCGPVYSMAQVFDDEQVREREMRRALRRADGQVVSVAANPIRLSDTPVRYDRAPPRLSEHTDDVLRELGMTAQDIAALRSDGIV
jgi:crotonobetainyl-CoA:carnitine CoA-transferase CaiB-like acyl-CoA transferase